MARAHVRELEPEGAVPGDASAADVQVAEGEVGVAVVGRRRRPPEGRVGVAVGEGQASARLDAPQGEGVAMARPGHEVLGVGPGAVGIAHLDDGPGLVGHIGPGEDRRRARELLGDGVALVAEGDGR